MRKWFYRHRKRIFAVLVISMLVYAFGVSCPAYEFGEQDPADPYPEYPTFDDENFVAYVPSGVGYQSALPLYDLNIIYSCRNTSNNALSFMSMPVGGLRSRYSGGIWSYDVFDGNSETLGGNIRDRFGVSYTTDSGRLQYTHQIDSFAPSSSVFDFLRFDLGDFVIFPLRSDESFVPKADVIRLIVQDTNYRDVPLTLTIRGSFRFIGNLNEYTFNYVENVNPAENGLVDFTLTAYDIMWNSTAEVSEVDEFVPIVVENCVVSISFSNIAKPSFFSYSVHVPVMSTFEANWLTYNNNVIYDYIYGAEPPEFNFEWLFGAVSGVLNAPLFGNPFGVGFITLGGVTFTIVACSLAVAIISLLSHLKA